MNQQKYINVYYAVSPQKMVAYGKWIAKIFFGVKPDINDYYSFVSNPVNGHFSFKVNQRYYRPSTTPQAEGEARALLNKLIAELKAKQVNAKDANLPKDFPSLFHSSQLKLQGISPNYHPNGNFIMSWSALYGIELQIFTLQSEDFQNKTGALESDSVIVEICGNTIVSLDHNYTPVIRKKAIPIAPNDNSEFVYKKINQTTVAPYYLTANGYIPACSESVPILTQPVSYGWNTVEKTPKTNTKSMITLSDIGHPDPDKGIPGSAKIVIAMDYRVITEGEGAVENMEGISSEDFTDLYKKGNIPGKVNRRALKLCSLPSVTDLATELTDYEWLQSSKKDITTGKFLYNDYYNVTIEYDYTLDISLKNTLWEGVKWMLESKYSRGLIFMTPFKEDAQKMYEANNYTTQDMKNTLGKEEQLNFDESDFNNLLIGKREEIRRNIVAKRIILVLTNILNEDIPKYSNTNLFVKMGVSDSIYQIIQQDIKFQQLLITLNSKFFRENQYDIKINPKTEIERYSTFYSAFKEIFEFSVDSFDLFKEEDGETGAAGKLGNPNYVIVNPKFFDKSRIGKRFYFNGMTPTEVLVHEAGHNAAAVFRHTKERSGNYEYHQTGLQSNEHTKTYPTQENTIKIINDEQNRENMKIL